MENVIENNRLIAEFMDLEKYYEGLEYIHNKCVYSADQLPYNTSWEWLMPVVDKIKNDDSCKILLPMGGLNDSIVPYINAIRPLNKALLDFNHQFIYTSVVAFINWYNNHKSPLTPINDNNH